MSMKLPLLAGGVLSVVAFGTALSGAQPELERGPARGDRQVRGFEQDAFMIGDRPGGPRGQRGARSGDRDGFGPAGPRGRGKGPGGGPGGGFGDGQGGGPGERFGKGPRGGGPQGPDPLMGAVDADGDGLVQRAELETAMRNGLERRQEQALEMFKNADLNGDGVVTQDEVLQRVNERHDDFVTRAFERFDKTDTDGDGAVSAEERRGARRAMGQRVRERLGNFRDRFDGDADGALSPEERREARRMIRVERWLDADRNGELDESDLAAAMQRFEAGQRVPDVNGDGVGNEADVAQMIDMIKKDTIKTGE